MTDHYAVIGHPIGHSKSPFIHGRFAEETGQAMDYVALTAPIGGFAATVDAFRAAGGRGLNITAPFKLDAHAYAGAVSDRARLAGAVNALRFEAGGAEGENFDGVGLVRDITVNAGQPIRGRRVLLLGAGGAARGALAPVLAENPARLVLVNRTPAKARALATAFADHGPITAGDVDQIAAGGFDLVINATSAGLTGAPPPAPASVFQDCVLAYDMTYGVGMTPFLARAREGGAVNIADGVGMLVEQAAETFAWWRGVRPATDAVLAELRAPPD